MINLGVGAVILGGTIVLALATAIVVFGSFYNIFILQISKKYLIKQKNINNFLPYSFLRKILLLQKNAVDSNFLLLICLFIASLSSQVILIIGYIRSDYRLLNVYQNSHHLKPLFYKITASWGNHEGSMLLLITIIVAMHLIFFYLGRKSFSRRFWLLVNLTEFVIIAFFLLFTLSSSNPFAVNLLAIGNLKHLALVNLEGMGLNPILQDIGLAMHPPMLYSGYLGFVNIFAGAVAILIIGKCSFWQLKMLRLWLLLSFSLLSCGIALGGWWAYRELGWGGYWFWDPVENISLMPWLLAIALLHSFKMTEKNQMLVWSLFLSIITFIFSLIGIFLTRSGLLSSVHSFAVDRHRGNAILLMLAVIGTTATIIFATRITAFQSKNMQNRLSSTAFSWRQRIWQMIFNNYLLIVALFTVFVGTIYPLLSQAIFAQSITIGASYYNLIFLVLLLPFVSFLIMSYLSRIEKIGKFLLLRMLVAVVVLFAFACYLENFDFFNFVAVESILAIFLLLLAILAVIISCGRIYNKISPPDGSKIKFTKLCNNLRKSLLKSNVNFAHFGFAIMLCGIIGNGLFSKDFQANLQVGQSLKISPNYRLNFKAIEYYQSANFIARVADFDLLYREKAIANLKPELRYFPLAKQATNEASIKLIGLINFYVVIGEADKDQFYAVNFHYQPLIILIWLGLAIMIITGVVFAVYQLVRKIKTLHLK